MPHRSSSLRPPYAGRYPHAVAVPTLPGGRGRRLNEMELWCRTRCGAHGEAWAMFDAIFYFDDTAIAAEFRATFDRER